jgi:ABC-type transport system involved in multi-copper enzyme maturation permease subunit
MNSILVIAKNTFKEVIRDRILYGLFLFAAMIIGVSLVLGQLSFAEQARISANFGLMAIHLGAIGIAVFVGSTLVIKELDKQTILTVLVRPLSRTQFIIGKFFGLASVISVQMFGLALVLLFIFYLIGLGFSSQLFIALLGIFLEALCLLGFTLFFSMFARPVLVVCFSVGVFLIGHWFSTLKYFSEKAPGTMIDVVYRVVRFGFPDLEALNWKNLVIYQEPVPSSQCMSVCIYAMLWIVLLVAATAALFERKDLA